MKQLITSCTDPGGGAILKLIMLMLKKNMQLNHLVRCFDAKTLEIGTRPGFLA